MKGGERHFVSFTPNYFSPEGRFWSGRGKKPKNRKKVWPVFGILERFRHHRETPLRRRRVGAFRASIHERGLVAPGRKSGKASLGGAGSKSPSQIHPL